MLSFRTAGESHGPALIAVVEGLPAHLPVDFDFIDHELKRRQGGYGRGGRMKIENRDWPNWEEIMSAREVLSDGATKRRVTRPRPGHTDLAGSLKYNHTDARNILERS